ncbi:MAG: S9 family peptidase [Dehalococcoidia bacterium]
MALDDSELEQFVRAVFDLPQVIGARVVPGGRHVTLLANIGETYQAYLWDSETGDYRQLTDQKDPVSQCVPDLGGKRAAILRDENGNELHRLSLVDLDASGTEERLVTSEPLGRLSIGDWLPDGRHLVVAGNDDEDNFVAVVDSQTGEMTKVFRSERWLGALDISEDGLRVALAVPRNPDDLEDYDIALFELASPDEVHWISTGEGHRNDEPLWSPDGTLLAFSAEIGDATRLMIYDSGDLSERASVELAGDVTALCYWSPGGSWIDLILDHHGADRLCRASLSGDTLQVEEAAVPVPGSVHGADREGDRIVLTASAIDRPLTSLTLVDTDLKEVGRLEVSGHKLELAGARSEWIDSLDGTPIQCWLIGLPAAGEQKPALVYAHGGPTWASKDSWRRDMQCLAAAGFALIAPNFRGSTGFGPDFRKANVLDLGGKDLEDCVAAAEWLRRQPGIDPARIGITGGSYGGYLTLQALVRYPQTFACGVGIVPVADWVQDYELADASFRFYDVYFFGGTPEEKPELYRERSPITFIQDLKAPLFISAGRNDSRCPFPPIEHFVETGWELGKEIEFDVQEEEGHGAARKTAAVESEMKVLKFLRKHLG